MEEYFDVVSTPPQLYGAGAGKKNLTGSIDEAEPDINYFYSMYIILGERAIIARPRAAQKPDRSRHR